MNGTATDKSTVVVTGAAGFIGSALVRCLLEDHRPMSVVSFDALTYAGHRENLDDLPGQDRHRFVQGDIASEHDVAALFEDVQPDALINVAAETHVDQSNRNARPFARTNVLGTQTVLECARAADIPMVHVSTDEVYGSLTPPLRATPTSVLNPTNPYSASKAAADLMVLAAHKTHGQDVRITRCTNNYGPRQTPEKLIPLMTLRAMAGEPLPVYGDGQQVRDWIHVNDHAAGIAAALKRGTAGSTYHFTADEPRTNLDVVHAILRHTGADRDLIRHVEDRPAHDRRYAIDDSATRAALNWAPTMSFDEGLRHTVSWYENNQAWCRATGSAALREFLTAHYGGVAP